MREIALPGCFDAALVDDDDYERLAPLAWRLQRSQRRASAYYRREPVARVAGQEVRMANVILGPPPPGMVWDHANGNPLDNRRSNLRAATPRQNNQNRRKGRTRSGSRFKGARRKRGRWAAFIKVDGREIQLGTFHDSERAARAYDEAARLYFGEFACVNFPRPGERSCLDEAG
jgi:hypothetical protein